MLAVILKILQIIGIVLLSLLGLVLVLVILALALPVTYRLTLLAEADKQPVGKLKIFYFLGLLRARAEYTDAFYVKVKVLFFTIFQMKIPDKDEPEEEEYDLSELDEALDALDEEEEDDIAPEAASETDESLENTEELSTEDEISACDSENPTEEPENEAENAFETDEESPENLDSDEYESDEDSFTDKIKFKVDEICDKIKRARSEIRYYRNVYNSNEAKNAVYVIKKRLMRILKKVMPGRAHAEITFGFDSPDLTGKVFGIYTLFAKRFDRTSKVVPNFERKIFEGEIFCKGHFNVWCILWNGLMIILNKNVRKIYKSYKHHTRTKDKEEAASDKAA